MKLGNSPNYTPLFIMGAGGWTAAAIALILKLSA